MDRENVISNLNGVYNYLKSFENTAKMGKWVHDAIELLQSQPQIVQCKDCDYWSDEGILTECSRFNGMSTDEYFFCAYGKPKGGDGE